MFFFRFLKNLGIRKLLFYLSFVLLIVFCFLTYFVFIDVDSCYKNSNKVISILYCDIIFALILLLLGSNKLVKFWSIKHKKGAKFTLRLISLFSIISIIPPVIMTVFSAFFFHSGIDSWFSERNKIVLRESLNVAESYLSEYKQHVINDCTAISKTIEYNISETHGLSDTDDTELNKQIGFLLDDICAIKGIDSAILLNSHLNIVAASKYSVSLHFLYIPENEIQKIDRSRKAMILKSLHETDKNIIAFSRFKNQNAEDMYLVIEKNIDSKILSRAQYAKNAYSEYDLLSKNRNSLEIAFILMFLIVSAILLIAAIVVAISYSWKIVNPISNLIDVSESIIDGNLNARANEVSSYEEISILIRTFNQMLSKIHKQRDDLVDINRQLDERIEFSSSVLAGVSSGVLGINNNNKVYTYNSAAEKLLGKKISLGTHIADISTKIKDILEKVNANNDHAEMEIEYEKNGEKLILFVKIKNMKPKSEFNSGYVITFDNLSDIIAAQRRAIWSDAARRVAHEIKNPLTPIQLSAERIKRKYSSQITQDIGVFNDLVNVIIRQVGDIKRLIDNFTLFAKLPEASMKLCNISDVCQQAAFLMQNATDNIKIIFTQEKQTYTIEADERLIHQSIVNLIQNAINALNSVDRSDKKIAIGIKSSNGSIDISVEDNGPGLPKEKVEFLATPYYSLMGKGTGLGLAIVKKIAQDHGGNLLFENSTTYCGAKITLSLPFR